MDKTVVFKSSLKNYINVVWHSRPVWKYYLQLRTHLLRSLGEEIASLFAEPNISQAALEGHTEASWLSDAISKNAKKLSALASEEQEKYKSLLAYKLQILTQYAEGLLTSEDSTEKEWGEMILKTLEIPDFDCVLAEGEKIVLVLWGFKQRSTQVEGFSLTKKIAGIAPVNPFAKEEKPLPKEDEKDRLIDPLVEEEELNSENQDSQHNEETKEIKEIVVTEAPENQMETASGDANVPPKDRDRLWLWRNWWWLLLLSLLLILGLFLLYYYTQKVENRLPKEPNVIIPIDTTKITIDEDSSSQIVSDRLNVAISAKGKTMEDFARVFKNHYPSRHYKIIYFDTTTFRVQLEVPAEEREKLKTDLKQKMPEFNLLIWDESIFKSNGKPSDPGFGNARQSWYHERVQAYDAWDISKGDPDLVIAVIDDGFDLSHPELSSKIYKPRNIPAHNDKPTIGNTGHGTHVAGLALSAAENGLGVAGLAPNCKFMPIQVGDRSGLMSATAIIDGVLYAIHNGADVINMSLGKMMLPAVANLPESIQEEMVAELFKDEEAFWNQLFKMTYDAGVTVVLAGGNQNIIIGLDAMQRTPYTINVSATDPNNAKASFSNYGRRSTLSAPGVQIYSSLPNNSFGPLDGTSMAAPIVAGAIGLMKSINPALSNGDIVDILQSTGLPIKNNGGRYIGNLIQLGNALQIADKRRQRMPKVDCPDAQDRIDKLLQEIERIREECNVENRGDTLKLPIGGNDLEFAKGRWKSTTPLFNVNNGEKVIVYFDFFSNGKGKITLVEERTGTECAADLALSMAAGKLNINQLSAAICNPPPGTYHPYTFDCEADNKGCAICTAQSKVQALNNFQFNLVRVNGT